MNKAFTRIFSLLLLITPVYLQAEKESQIFSQWTPLHQDLKITKRSVPDTLFFTTTITIIKAPLNHYHIEVLPASLFGKSRMRVQEFCSRTKATLCINANFFDEQGKALGLIVQRGQTLQPVHRGGDTLTGILQITKNSTEIIPRERFQFAPVFEAVQAGPRLVSRGKVLTTGIPQRGSSRRSGICLNDNNEVLFFVTSSGFRGISISDFQKIMTDTEIGCVEGLNLDGGGSAQLSPGKSLLESEVNLHTPGRDEVPVALALFPNTIK